MTLEDQIREANNRQFHGAVVALARIDAETTGWEFRYVWDEERCPLTNIVEVTYSAYDWHGRERDATATYRENIDVSTVKEFAHKR